MTATPLLDPFWAAALDTLIPGAHLQPAQRAALDAGLLDSAARRNFIVSAPTNAGKTLIGDLACLDALRRGARAVLLEPLRALAQEKHDEWTARRPALAELLGRDVHVTLSTGDYRLEDERFTDLPGQGELVIATPEKLEALLRRPEHAPWFADVDVVVVDEAHLLSSRHRGPTLELLLSRLRALPTPPRFVLLSGTVGDTAAAEAWLQPCEVIRVTERTTPLTLDVLTVPEASPDTGKGAGGVDAVVTAWLQEALAAPQHRALVFVYQTASAGKLARTLEQTLGAGVARAYHAQLPRAQRDATKTAFLNGECRVIVTTTALAMGLNLPCSHVLVRDATFPGAGRVEVDVLLQMLGRAGRGTQAGTGVVTVRATDAWGTEELRQALKSPQFPPLRSAFETLDPSDRRPAEQITATLLAAHREPVPATALESILRHSLGGPQLAGQLRGALMSLERQKLAYRAPVPDTQSGAAAQYALTWLGRQAVRAVLPLPIAAGYAQLLRDLMETEPDDHLLEHWRPMDTLLLLNLLSDRPPNLGWRWSEALASSVDAWCEQFGAQAPQLYAFIRGVGGTSRAGELLGSLGLPLPPGRRGEPEARKLAYQALARAAILYERSRGRSLEDTQRRWGIRNLAGVEERWRDEMLWLLGGVSEVLDPPGYVYHLRERCHADTVRLKRVKASLIRQRQQTWALSEGLKRCSPLGALLDDIRRNQLGRGPRIGVGSIQKLEAAGITDIAGLLPLSEDDLHGLGLRRDFARQLLRYLQRRRTA
ncbi:DEAD/DEAH box helicase [Deinococcus knuensis]|uniref:DEAD/DEAH box helicase n=1 Tax=Deinococcus knuensis TaxID=1837380 RepID=A0ABQ2SUW8_9DEIO|nr:DEAD/DEAH box helicase [Deinococcus knuensis]GGS37522.1 hypothetical protein GCM10008961_31360 [Deinococcus knuensis]